MLVWRASMITERGAKKLGRLRRALGQNSQMKHAIKDWCKKVTGDAVIGL
jgi:hypothetical protein